MTKSLRFLFLIRHAECYKNVRDEQGGPGDRLTPNGKKQLARIRLKLVRIARENSLKTAFTFYYNVPQVAESAVYVSKIFASEPTPEKRMRPAGLGDLAGLSRREAAKHHPEVADRLERWREGKLEVRDLRIPGAEPFDSYWKRGTDFINGLPNTKDAVLLVSSRSFLILSLNILLHRNPYEKGRYLAWDFALASFAVFTRGVDWTFEYAVGIHSPSGKSLSTLVDAN
jgi:broad specificity phosphatase PhoE